MRRAERCAALCVRFRQVYPEARCGLDFGSPYQLLVATVLSAQCTDKRVNLVTPALFRAYPDAAAMAEAEREDVEALIRSTGFFRSKAGNLIAAARAILRDHGGEVPRTMDELAALPGVGRKTANVVLGNAFGINEGIVVDTHVGRLSRRLGLTGREDPVQVERDLVRIVPGEDWTLFSHWLIEHGRRRCKARGPDCAGCEVGDLCPSRERFLKDAARRKSAPGRGRGRRGA